MIKKHNFFSNIRTIPARNKNFSGSVMEKHPKDVFLKLNGTNETLDQVL